jgi:PPM family protein phosphatase
MALQFDIAGAQIDGARDYQEDAFLISRLTDADGNQAALVIVADGMGGHAAGNVASNMAVQAFNKYVTGNYPADDLPGVLHTAVLKANGSIAETIRETPALEGMGCTMVAVLVEDHKLWWASVGDSHLYLLRDKELTKQNADHSYGGFLDRMAAAGNPIEPEAGLSRNMLMSAITGEDITEIDCPEQPLELRHGDRIILCSDGLDTLSSGKIIQYCEWSEKARECGEALLNAVEEAAMPRQDNATVVVLDAMDPAALAAETEQQAPVLELTTADDEDQTAPQPVAPAPPAQAREPAIQRDWSGIKSGLMAAFAIILVLAVAGGGYLLWQQLSGHDPDAIEPVATEESFEVPPELLSR